MDDLFILLQMPTPRLKFVTNRMRQESSIVPHGNRVYYLATTFEVGLKFTFYYITE